MLSLLSKTGSGRDREELCIQIVELFANIDVNGDRTMEWEEFLNYIVEIGYGAGNTGGGGGAGAGGAGESGDSFSKYTYRGVVGASTTAEPAALAHAGLRGQDGAGPASAHYWC